MNATQTHTHNGMPAFIRASLWTASQGGTSSYESAGYQLGRHLERESPNSVDDEAWFEILNQVDSFIDDDDQLTEWIGATYPRIWACVPPRRRSAFVDGVRRGRFDDVN